MTHIATATQEPFLIRKQDNVLSLVPATEDNITILRLDKTRVRLSPPPLAQIAEQASSVSMKVVGFGFVDRNLRPFPETALQVASEEAVYAFYQGRTYGLTSLLSSHYQGRGWISSVTLQDKDGDQVTLHHRLGVTSTNHAKAETLIHELRSVFA